MEEKLRDQLNVFEGDDRALLVTQDLRQQALWSMQQKLREEEERKEEEARLLREEEERRAAEEVTGVGQGGVLPQTQRVVLQYCPPQTKSTTKLSPCPRQAKSKKMVLLHAAVGALCVIDVGGSLPAPARGGNV